MMVNWHRPPKLDPHGQARPDWLPCPSCKVTLVCGPPASGKSTLVAERAAPHDLVVDLDEIRSQLTNSALYEATDDGLGLALAERNRRLADLSRQPSWRHAWVIVSAPAEARRWWQDKPRRSSCSTFLPRCASRVSATTAVELVSAISISRLSPIGGLPRR
jgi:hypothetical protein